MVLCWRDSGGRLLEPVIVGQVWRIVMMDTNWSRTKGDVPDWKRSRIPLIAQGRAVTH